MQVWKGREIMNTKKCYLVLAVVTGILCVPALGKVELPLAENKPVLLAKANEALAGIEKLYVVIEWPDAEPNKDGLVWKELRSTVKDKLNKAGIRVRFESDIVRVSPSRALILPELRIDTDMLKLDDAQRYVFHIETSLASKVSLVKQPRRYIKADVWKVGPVMQATTVQNMAAEVTKTVLSQVETFINCYLVANPKGVRPADANDISATPKKRARPIAKPTAAEYKYIGSRNSSVFHIAGCSSAKRIKHKNLVAYNSRIEAIRAGRRPCKRCKP